MADQTTTEKRLAFTFDRQAIRRLRGDKGLTQEALAHAANLSLATVARVEGGVQVSLETATAICGTLDVELDVVATLCEDVVVEPKRASEDELFGDMMRHLSEIVGEDAAKRTMDDLFVKLRRFPFGTDARNKLYKNHKVYDVKALIAILELRAGAIRRALSYVEEGHHKLTGPEDNETNIPLEAAKAMAQDWRRTFDELHEAHLRELRNGELLIAHETRHLITGLLEEIRSTLDRPDRCNIERSKRYKALLMSLGIYSSH